MELKSRVLRRPVVQLVSIVGIAAALLPVANAAVTVYQDRAAFAAVVGESAAVIDFEGLAEIASPAYFGNPGSLTQQGVQFTSNSPMFVQNVNSYQTGSFLSAQQSNPEMMTVQLGASYTAVGFQYFADRATSLVMTLSSGETINMPLTPQFPNAAFIGITSTGPITSLQVVAGGPGIDIDNFTFATGDFNSVSTLIDALFSAVTGVGPGKSLANKMAIVQAYFVAGDMDAACAQLTGFENQVKAQTGKKLSAQQSAAFLAGAQAIRNAMGCE